VHLIVAFYASPKKILLIEEMVNQKMKYPFEGAMTGYTRPFLSKLPLGLYDIRCKEEIAPLVLRDLQAQFCKQDKPRTYFRKWRTGKEDQEISLDNTRNMTRKIYFAIRLLRILLHLRTVERAPLSEEFRLPGWHYCWFLGAWPDARDARGNEIL
jgi:hypothetical protein